MILLEKTDILLINHLTIKRHGGNFVPPKNILNEEPLDYMLEMVNATVFGEEAYPKVWDKAAFYMFSIIANHVFQDGNKRTGLEAALLFLRLNNYQLKEHLSAITIDDRIIPEKGNTSNEILFNFTMGVASGHISLEQCQAWFEQNSNFLR
jgi:death-on-curing protein